MIKMKTMLKKTLMMLLSVRMRAASESRYKQRSQRRSLRVPAHRQRPLLTTSWPSPTAYMTVCCGKAALFHVSLTEHVTCLGDIRVCFHTPHPLPGVGSALCFNPFHFIFIHKAVNSGLTVQISGDWFIQIIRYPTECSSHIQNEKWSECLTQLVYLWHPWDFAKRFWPLENLNKNNVINRVV